MMWSVKRVVGGVVLGCGAVLVLAQAPMEDLLIPLEHYPGGQVKTELQAEEAKVPPDGRIVATGLTLKTFTPDGALEMVVTAEDCVCDRVNEVASSSNRVALKRGDIRISGTGFTWHGKDEKLKILNRARVVLPSALVKEEKVLNDLRK